MAPHNFKIWFSSLLLYIFCATLDVDINIYCRKSLNSVLNVARSKFSRVEFVANPSNEKFTQKVTFNDHKGYLYLFWAKTFLVHILFANFENECCPLWQQPWIVVLFFGVMPVSRITLQAFHVKHRLNAGSAVNDPFITWFNPYPLPICHRTIW